MRLAPRRDRRRPGVAAVEFATLLPLLLILVLGMREVGRLIQISQIVANAAREGGRQASTAKYDKEAVRQAVLDYLKNAGVHCHGSIPNESVTLSNANVS